MIVCVTGGRDYHFGEGDFRVLDLTDERHGIELLMHGGANGADHSAAFWATMLRGIPEEVMPVLEYEWTCYGRRAGPMRNRKMAAKLAEYKSQGKKAVLIAYPGGSGTANMVEEARKRGITVAFAVNMGGGDGRMEKRK